MLKAFLPVAVTAFSLLGSGCSRRPLETTPPPDVIDNRDGSQSFVVTAAVLDDTVTLTLHLDREHRRLTAGWLGAASTISVQPDGDEWVGSDTLALGRSCAGPSNWGARVPSALVIQELRLRTTSGASGARLTVKGSANLVSGDTVIDNPLDSAFTGGIDEVAPSMVGCVPLPSMLDFPVAPDLTFSEPLAAGAVVRLVPDVGEPRELTPRETLSAEFRGGAVLAWGRRYQVDVQPYRDLAGIAGQTAALPSFTTPAIDFAPADGFESATAPAVLRGGAQLDGATAPEPLAGTRSLYLPAGASYAARLAVAPGDTVVRLAARGVLGESGWATPAGQDDFAVELAAPDGVLTRTWLHSGQEPFTADANDAKRQVGSAATLSVPLPPGVTDEVMIHIVNESGIQSTERNVQIDDLRVE